MITTERLKQIVYYDSEAGIFRWMGRCKNKVVGSNHSGGYKEAKIEGYRVYLHRAAWQYVYGEVPKGQIDHINGDRSDNRIFNLRLATQQQNSANMKKRPNNTSGFKSVYFNKTNKKWIAQICIDYKIRYIGSFLSPEEAHQAYLAKAREVFGSFARSA